VLFSGKLMTEDRTHQQLETGKDVHVDADPKAFGDKGRSELGDGLKDIVDGVPETDIVGIEGRLAFDGDGGELSNEA
jgi:hypothetical protein